MFNFTLTLCFMFNSLASHTRHNSILHTHIHTLLGAKLTLDLLLHQLFSQQQRSSSRTVQIIDTKNKNTGHFWIKHIIIPRGGAVGGFKATKIAIHSIQRHRETSRKDFVRCWYETWYDTPGKNGIS